jgi:Ca-activated chloride channel family protein
MPSQVLAPQRDTPRAPILVSTDGRTYPLRSAHARARAEGGIAATTLVQEFSNPYDEPLEVSYAMPLPADGAVLSYTIKIGERIIRGVVEPREKAEAKYRKALYEGRTAGLLEQDRADTFTQRLGNLPPRTGASIEIEILQPLAFLVGVGVESGVERSAAGASLANAGPVWEYRFPTVVGTRYEGAPGRVSDAGRLDVDREGNGGLPTRVGLHLAIADPISNAAQVTLRWKAPAEMLVGVKQFAEFILTFAIPSGADRPPTGADPPDRAP